MPARILVVDRNEAFATMLQDMLVADGGYHVEVARSGSDALDHLQRAEFDLTIVDVDLDPEDMGYRQLIQAVRATQPSMRLMLIPLMGKDLPAEARQLNVQGALSKPFFADDLLPNIKDVLSKPMSPPPRPSAPPPAAPVPDEGASSDVEAVLTDLARETRADAVLLILAADGEEEIVAQASTLRDEQTRALAERSVTVVRAAQAAAHLLGRSDAPFEHNMFEGQDLRLYVWVPASEVLLVVVAPLSVPLGTIRHNLRRAGRHLDGLALT